MEISEKFGKSLVDKSVFLVLWKNWKNSASRLQTPVTMESIGNSQFKGKYGFWNVEFKLFFSTRFVCLPFPLWGEGAESALPTCNQNPSVNMNSKIEARIKELWRVMFAFSLDWSSYFQDSTLLYYTPLLSGWVLRKHVFCVFTLENQTKSWLKLSQNTKKIDRVGRGGQGRPK